VVIRERDEGSLQWIIATGVLLAVSIISEGFYIKTDKEYDDLITDDQSEYDNLDREANRWLLVRNVTGVSCSLTGCYALYRHLNKH